MIRPIKLEIEGLNSFIERQTVDFERLSENNLFCISGKTGSGKTTILDALILSLYEQLDGDSSRGNNDDYINLRCGKARIEFTFELDGELLRTERVISRKAGQNSTKLIDVATGVSKFDKATEVWAYLKEKLVLDVKQFSQVIVLQKGKFARFLKASAKDRNNMILSLFSNYDYDKLSPKFNAASRHLKDKIDGLDDNLANYEGLTKDYLDGFKRDVGLAEKAAKDCENAFSAASKQLEKAKKIAEERGNYLAALAELSETEGQITAAEQAKNDALRNKEELVGTEQKLAEKRLKKQQNLSEKSILGYEILNHESIIAKSEELDGAKGKLLLNEKELDEKEKKLSEISEQLAQKKAKLSTYNLTLSVREAADEKARLKTLYAEFKTANDDYAASVKRLESLEIEGRSLAEKKVKAEERLEKAKKAIEDKQNELDALRREDGLAFITKGLKVGDKCPVCGGIIEDLTAHKSENALVFEDMENTIKRWQDKRQQISDEFNALIGEVAKNQADVKNEVAAGDKLYAVIRSFNATENAEKRRVLDEYSIVTDEVSTLSAELTALSTDCAASKKLVENQKQIASALYVEIEKLKGQLKYPDKSEIDKKMAEIDAFSADLERDEQAFSDRKIVVERALYEAGERLAGLNAKKKELLRRTEKKPEENVLSIEALEEKEAEAKKNYSDAVATFAELKTELAQKQKDYDKKRELEAKKSKLAEKLRKIDDLAKLFLRSEFKSFVATEYIRDFTAVASDILSDLTGGKYTIDYEEDGANSDFFITDFLSNNEKRKAGTLSGGETFLASLAMAIALSQEIVSRGGFDFFFIDEGFGTLHEQALEQALDVLTRLSGRSLVGLVTHRSELKERIPVTVEVIAADEEHGSLIKIV